MKKDKDLEIVEKFMKEIDLPDWFRGLSEFQRKAADSLFHCIRDDCEQATSHRVWDTLRRIGIEPLVGYSEIKFIFELCGGNDIAFLWFLMEMYYRSERFNCNGKKYSVNEQIIITVIAYLDTVTTLRELDKLLPKNLETKTKKKKRFSLRKRKSTTLLGIPYFQKQPRPHLYGKSLILNELDTVTNFSELGNYLDPHYTVSNEANRWFAKYELGKSERIAKGIINNEIDTIFEEERSQEHQKDHKLSLCEHHKTVQAIKETLANEQIVAKRKACEKYFDVKRHFKNLSYKRVIEDLNSEINKTAEDLENSKQQVGGGIDVPEKDQVPQEANDENLSLYNFGHDAAISSKCIYFKGPKTNKPYKFNYHKIFDYGVKNPIKDAVELALDANSSGNISMEHNRAIKKCCKAMWAQAVKNFNDKYKKDQKSDQVEIKEDKILFDQTPRHIDPRDNKLIQSILLKALNEIKKNKKFVLASLPDAHKYPTLREWVRKRYGMAYTREEKRKAFQRTKRVFQVLRNNTLRVRIPHVNDLSEKRIVSYGCREYLIKKTNYLRAIYEDNFKESLLNDARTYYVAIRPYHCTKGPPRNVFFSYLPPRKNDVHTFRPWHNWEYIHAQEEWNRRQRIKKAEVF
ncbi:uncharacterized protein LOC129939885 [Eupeodes corollae]|uniref:uncharacterized protein LOC129939885 n=1 Tax=Eupeodes corollae TaxID=290404 RepID=UPI0024918715|nr:uncharacterized protein LOC129939885 [Eupeodes corollae]